MCLQLRGACRIFWFSWVHIKKAPSWEHLAPCGLHCAVNGVLGLLLGKKIVIACHWLLQYWIWFQDTVLWKLKIYEKWIFLMKNVERLKIHNEGMKIHKISIENTFSYCILVSLGAPPAVVLRPRLMPSVAVIDRVFGLGLGRTRPFFGNRPRPNYGRFYK